MILLGAIHDNNDSIEFKVYGSNKIQTLRNVSSNLEGIFKFKDPMKGSEKDKFIIKYFGNREIFIDGIKHDIAHYILLKEKENSNYLIDVDMFNELFEIT